MKRGEIYLIEFPFSDISQTKKRPALVVGEIKGNNTIFSQISTKNKLTKDYKVELKQSETKGEIIFDSYIYCDMLFTLHKDLVVRKIGEISKKKLEEVRDILNMIF